MNSRQAGALKTSTNRRQMRAGKKMKKKKAPTQATSQMMTTLKAVKKDKISMQKVTSQITPTTQKKRCRKEKQKI